MRLRIASCSLFAAVLVSSSLGCSWPASSIGVGIAGSGSGQVIADGANVSCDSDPSRVTRSCVLYWPHNQVPSSVTLIAVPDSNSVFVGWEGECSGDAHCVASVGYSTKVSAKFVRAVYEDLLLVDRSGAELRIGSFFPTKVVGDTTLTSQGEADLYISKSDPSAGLPAWAVSLGGREADQIHSAEIDEMGDIILLLSSPVITINNEEFNCANASHSMLIKISGVDGHVMWGRCLQR